MTYKHNCFYLLFCAYYFDSYNLSFDGFLTTPNGTTETYEIKEHLTTKLVLGSFSNHPIYYTEYIIYVSSPV